MYIYYKYNYIFLAREAGAVREGVYVSTSLRMHCEVSAEELHGAVESADTLFADL